MMMKKFLLIISFVCFISSHVAAQPLANGDYLIKIKQTLKYFTIEGFSNNNGARLVQTGNDYVSHFQFTLTHLGNNVYSLKSASSGKYLSTEGTPQRGAKVIQWDWLNQDNQKWIIVKSPGSNYYSISCYQNKMRITLQNWGAATTQSGEGAYAFITDDISVSQPLFDFKKNETRPVLEKPVQLKKVPVVKSKG